MHSSDRLDHIDASASKNVPVLTFHKVDSRFEWGITRNTPAQFEAFLRFMKEEGYEGVSFRDLSDPARSLPEKPVVLTFDDSYESVFLHAYPLLRSYGFRGTLFVITGFVGTTNTWDVNTGGILFRHLTWPQISRLADDGFEIGSHTVHHPDLTRIGPEKMNRELIQSREILSARLGRMIDVIAYPFGRYNQSVLDASRAAGYAMACVYWNSPRIVQTEPYRLYERKTVYLVDSLLSLKAKLVRTPLASLENVKLRLINLCSYGTSLLKPPRWDRYGVQNEEC